MNTPVKFEIAKLLKEKGFDEYTKIWHQRGDGVVGCVEGKRDFYNRKGDVYTSAPTIAEVVMWVYEKHEYWCYTYTNGKMWYPCIQHKFGDMAVLSGKIGTYNSSIEAYEEAIKYTLNNLI